MVTSQSRWRHAPAKNRDFTHDDGVYKIPNIELTPEMGQPYLGLWWDGICGGELASARYIKNCSDTIFPSLTS
jgi:hypothetical protein